MIEGVNHQLAEHAKFLARSTLEKKEAKTHKIEVKRKLVEMATVETKKAQTQAAAETSKVLTKLGDDYSLLIKRAANSQKKSDLLHLQEMQKISEKSTKEIAAQKAAYEALRTAHDANNMKAEIVQSMKTEMRSLFGVSGHNTNTHNNAERGSTPTAGGANQLAESLATIMARLDETMHEQSLPDMNLHGQSMHEQSMHG